jgi:hypothetical protein
MVVLYRYAYLAETNHEFFRLQRWVLIPQAAFAVTLVTLPSPAVIGAIGIESRLHPVIVQHSDYTLFYPTFGTTIERMHHQPCQPNFEVLIQIDVRAHKPRLWRSIADGKTCASGWVLHLWRGCDYRRSSVLGAQSYNDLNVTQAYRVRSQDMTHLTMLLKAKESVRSAVCHRLSSLSSPSES